MLLPSCYSIVNAYSLNNFYPYSYGRYFRKPSLYYSYYIDTYL